MKGSAVIKYTDDSADTSADAQRLSYMKIIVEALITAMGNGDERILCCAARFLGKLKAKDAVKHLVEYLKYPDPDVICDAASALGKIGEKESTPHLVQLLKDEDGLVRMCAIQALSDIGDSLAVEPLIQSMNSTVSFPVILGELSGDYQWEIRERAAKALGKIKDQRAVQALIEILKDEDADMMLGTIFKSLVQQGERKGLEAAASYLKDPDISIRRKASKAFIYTNDTIALDYLKEALVDEDTVVKCNAIEAIRNIGSGKDTLIFVLLLKDKDVDVRKTAAEAIVKIDGKKAVRHILPLLHDVSSDVRRMAVELLGSVGGIDCIGPIINMLKDSDSEVCGSAITLLGRLKDSRGVNPLITILRDKEKDKMLRSKAILALADTCSRMPAPASSKQGYQAGIGEAEGLGAVLEIMMNRQEDLHLRQMTFKLLKNFDKQMVVDNISKTCPRMPLSGVGNADNEFVQLELARSLRDFNDAKSEDMLLELMNSENEAIKREAVLSLTYRGNEAALDILVSMITGEDRDAIKEACDAIKNIKNEKALNLLINFMASQDAAVRYSAVKAIGYTWNKDVVPAVIGLLKDDNKDVRREAVIVLGKLSDKRGLAPLVSVLYDYERFNDMRKEIAISCMDIDTAAAIRLIVGTLNDQSKKDCHWAAIEALSEISGLLPKP
ncbi:MAG: HEAT repeat domain-containing protein [Deltaproteobacteria bacterium]|nr:HEAT repeat domain-containing protein [Deltaproteobacteria bacterium]